MKKELLIASIFASAVAVAGSVTTSNVMGLVKVNDDSAKASQDDYNVWLVTAPLTDYGSDANIAVADVLQTASLAEDDELWIPNGSGYNMYKLQSDGKWKAAKTVTAGPNGIQVTSADSPDVATVSRGQAFWVKTKATQINLFGEGVMAAKSVTVSGGTTKKAWSLIGSTAQTGSIDLSSLSGKKGDMIRLANGQEYMYGGSGDSAGWYKKVNGAFDTSAKTTDTIAAGIGFWYATKEGIEFTSL